MLVVHHQAKNNAKDLANGWLAPVILSGSTEASDTVFVALLAPLQCWKEQTDGYQPKDWTASAIACGKAVLAWLGKFMATAITDAVRAGCEEGRVEVLLRDKMGSLYEINPPLPWLPRNVRNDVIVAAPALAGAPLVAPPPIQNAQAVFDDAEDVVEAAHVALRLEVLRELDAVANPALIAALKLLLEAQEKSNAARKEAVAVAKKLEAEVSLKRPRPGGEDLPPVNNSHKFVVVRICASAFFSFLMGWRQGYFGALEKDDYRARARLNTMEVG